MSKSEPRNETPPPRPAMLASDEMVAAVNRLRKALRSEGIRIRDVRYQAAAAGEVDPVTGRAITADTEEGLLLACEDGAEVAISVLLTKDHVITYAPHGSVRYGRGYFPPAFFAAFIKQVFTGRANIEALGEDPL